MFNIKEIIILGSFEVDLYCYVKVVGPHCKISRMERFLLANRISSSSGELEISPRAIQKRMGIYKSKLQKNIPTEKMH